MLDQASAAAGLRVEYKVLALNGTESAWTAHPQFCGTRGRHLPLVGLALRIVGEKAAHYRCEYQLAFVSGQLSAVGKNGMPLRSARPGDPIADIRVTLSPLAATQGKPALPAVPSSSGPGKAPASKPAQPSKPKTVPGKAVNVTLSSKVKPGKAVVVAAPAKRPTKKK
jgi:hypothetical protein